MPDLPGRKDQTMKILHIFAATGLAVASLTVSTSADAQRWDGYRGGGWHDGYRGDYGRGWDRGWHRGWRDRDYRGWYGPRYRPYRYYGWRGDDGWYGPRCWTEWRYGYRVRICR